MTPRINCAVLALVTAVLVLQACQPTKRVRRPHAVSHEGEREFTNTIGMQFVRVPVQSFTMGNDKDAKASPEHTVDLTRPYYLQTTEVTQAQWKKIMGAPNQMTKPVGDDLPVNMITWNMAQNFIAKLNELESCDNYRLPSEAEWEYAAKFGGLDSLSSSALADNAWYYNNSGDKPPDNSNPSPSDLNCQPHSVATKEPSTLGLYDMLGNVEEYCQDRYHQTGYENTPTDGSPDERNVNADGTVVTTPTPAQVSKIAEDIHEGKSPPPSQSTPQNENSPTWQGNIWRTLRGGAFDSLSSRVTPTARHGVSPDFAWFTHGLRVLYDPHPRTR